MNNTTYGILVMGGIAIIFLGVAALFFVIRKNSKKKIDLLKQLCTNITPATVIKMDRKRFSHSDYYTYVWYPTYEYYVYGVRCEKESSVGNSKKLFEEGQQTELYYNPNNSEEIYVPAEKIESRLTLYTIFSLGFGMCGFLAIVIWVIFL